VEFSELDEFMDTPIKNYSSGMHARLGFALAVQLNPDVLLIDEVLAVGDEPFQDKCKKYMNRVRAQGKTIVFVSHSAEENQNDLQSSVCAGPRSDGLCRQCCGGD
jgi:ABC-2 type transport system ATP-binding protein/lipopolysaccharide transport system ATP-binding protein